MAEAEHRTLTGFVINAIDEYIQRHGRETRPDTSRPNNSQPSLNRRSEARPQSASVVSSHLRQNGR